MVNSVGNRNLREQMEAENTSRKRRSKSVISTRITVQRQMTRGWNKDVKTWWAYLAIKLPK